MDQRLNGLAADENSGSDLKAVAPVCRGIRPNCAAESTHEPICVDCVFLHERNYQTSEDLDFLRHCRSIRQYVDDTITALIMPYVAVCLVSPTGWMLNIDKRSAKFLCSNGELGILKNRIWAPDAQFDLALLNAIRRVSYSAEPETLVCRGGAALQMPYTILLQPYPGALTCDQPQNVVCIVFPLRRRRIASAKQLMSMFALTAAEARLVRALCHGETLDGYAITEGIKIPTVKTHLRSAFAKTQTDRQAALIQLISGIPPLR